MSNGNTRSNIGKHITQVIRTESWRYVVTELLIYALAFIYPLVSWILGVFTGNYYAEQSYKTHQKNMFTEYNNLNFPAIRFIDYNTYYLLILPSLMLLMGWVVVLFTFNARMNFDMIPDYTFYFGYLLHFVYTYLAYILLWGLGTLQGMATLNSIVLFSMLLYAIVVFNRSRFLSVVFILEFFIFLCESISVQQLAEINTPIWT